MNELGGVNIGKKSSISPNGLLGKLGSKNTYLFDNSSCCKLREVVAKARYS